MVYLKLLESFYDTRHILIKTRRLSVWLSYGLPGAGEFRRRLFQLNDCSSIIELSEKFFKRTSSFPVSCYKGDEAFMMGGHG